MIHSPGPRLLRRRRRGRIAKVIAELNLTPLVDVLTVLVIFALQNYGVPDELI